MNKFKKGDWVRAIVDRYSRTTYMKPCKVIEVIDEYKIKVETCDTCEVWDVESKNFDYVPLHEILHKGDIVYHKSIKETSFTFEGYLREGIMVVNNTTNVKECLLFKDIVYRKSFKV